MGVVPMNQSSVEKKGWVRHSATRLRPVAARASFTAAVVTSDPFLANFTMSAPGTCSTNVSAARSSSSVGRVKLRPCEMARVTAEITGSYPWPRVTDRSPMPYSTNVLPSTSSTRAPEPRTKTGAMPSGYWSEPRA